VVTPTTAAVVLIPFPFSDLSRAKLRPAVVLADAGRGDWILAQVTSKPYGDPRALPLRDIDFQSVRFAQRVTSGPGRSSRLIRGSSSRKSAFSRKDASAISSPR